jgi:hypothetical protein
MDAGTRFELVMLRAYETGVVAALPAIKNLCASLTKPATYTLATLPCHVALWSNHVAYKTWSGIRESNS